jgi:hypothetical protein
VEQKLAVQGTMAHSGMQAVSSEGVLVLVAEVAPDFVGQENPFESVASRSQRQP